MQDRETPWIDVPDDWLDDRYSRDDSYRTFQEYFGLKVKPAIINEHLVGKVVLPDTIIDVVRLSATESVEKLGVDATLRLTGNTRTGGRGTDTVEIYRTINRVSKECSFDKIGSSRIDMKGFGVEYYRRAIPFLRKLGINKITAMPTTGPEEFLTKYRLIGAYVWSFYGYSNDNMAGTLNHYLDYLQCIRKIKLSQAMEKDKTGISRMLDIAKDKINGEDTGKKFLLGFDEYDNPTRSLWWNGSHNNIFDESASNKEMTELVNYLLSRMPRS